MISRSTLTTSATKSSSPGIDIFRILPVEALRDPIRADERDFAGMLRDLFQEAELVRRHVARQADLLSRHGPALRHRRAFLFALVRDLPTLQRAAAFDPFFVEM